MAGAGRPQGLPIRAKLHGQARFLRSQGFSCPSQFVKWGTKGGALVRVADRTAKWCCDRPKCLCWNKLRTEDGGLLVRRRFRDRYPQTSAMWLFSRDLVLLAAAELLVPVLDHMDRGWLCFVASYRIHKHEVPVGRDVVGDLMGDRDKKMRIREQRLGRNRRKDWGG